MLKAEYGGTSQTQAPARINIGFVDCAEFPTGSYLRRVSWAIQSVHNQSEHGIKWIHPNWISGYENKVHFMQQLNHWYVEQTDEEKILMKLKYRFGTGSGSGS